MDASDGLAPEIQSIIDVARKRGGDAGRIEVVPRSLQTAFDRAERDGRVPLIAEVKPTSPTTDGHRSDDPVDLAREMVAGGAAALSVLTEPEHFGGSPDTLRRVRAAVDVPVLRKDFVLSESQLDVVKADLVLLIVRFLEEDGMPDLGDLITAARDRGFQPLVETHSRHEVRRAIDAGADIIGVNNRDLGRLELDLGRFEAVGPAIPDDVTLIAESGIETTADVQRMRAAGADGILVGSAIMDGDVRENTSRLTTPAGSGS